MCDSFRDFLGRKGGMLCNFHPFLFGRNTKMPLNFRRCLLWRLWLKNLLRNLGPWETGGCCTIYISCCSEEDPTNPSCFIDFLDVGIDFQRSFLLYIYIYIILSLCKYRHNLKTTIWKYLKPHEWTKSETKHLKTYIITY